MDDARGDLGLVAPERHDDQRHAGPDAFWVRPFPLEPARSRRDRRIAEIAAGGASAAEIAEALLIATSPSHPWNGRSAVPGGGRACQLVAREADLQRDVHDPVGFHGTMVGG